MTKFLFRKSRKCIQKSSKKIFAFIIDFGKSRYGGFTSLTKKCFCFRIVGIIIKIRFVVTLGFVAT